MRAQLWKCTLVLALAIFLHQVMAATTGPRVIYGGDDRIDYYQVTDAQIRAMSDATVALMRPAILSQQGNLTKIATIPYGQSLGLCPNEPFYQQETAAFCSGFLISPDTVVTAGHCISDQSSCANTRLVLGYRVEQKDVQPQTVPSSNVYSCASVVHSVVTATQEDFAVVKLDRPVTHVSPLAYRTHGRVTIGENLHVIGYPAGLPLKVAAGASVRDVKAQHFVANLDTYGGNSGSAVFNAVTGEVEGILVRGEMDYTIQDGCRVSNICTDTGCRGEDVTLFERVLPYIH